MAKPFQPGDHVRPVADSELLADFRGITGKVTGVERDGNDFRVWVVFPSGGYASHVPAAEFEPAPLPPGVRSREGRHLAGLPLLNDRDEQKHGDGREHDHQLVELVPLRIVGLASRR